MANTNRGRKLNYDNIAVGVATGVERTIAGGTLPPAEKVGGLDNIATGVAFPTAVIADNSVVAVATAIGERLG
jgi:hypothetical protein